MVGSSEGSCWQGGDQPRSSCHYGRLFALITLFQDCMVSCLTHDSLTRLVVICNSFCLLSLTLKQGILNDQFSQIQTLKSVEEPEHVVQLIDTYFIDVETILSELTTYIDYPDFDFSKLATLAHKVEERSLSIGAEHVRLACAYLIQACNQMNEENLSKALIWIKNEFAHTRNKLEAYVQMERRIIRLKSRQQNRSCVP